MSEHALETLVEEVRALRAENERLADRVADLESEVNTLETETESLENETETLEDRVADLEQTQRTREIECNGLETELDHLRDRLDDCESETDRLDAVTEATRNRTGANKARLEELQARELEKGAHLLTTNVDEHDLDVQGDQLERLTKSDGRSYYRLPDQADPLERGGEVSLAHSDLLPIQQLARMDEEMRRSTTNALPTRLAAKLWQARTDPTVGDDPWSQGCTSVREYVAASDLKHWIRRQESGISESYAKKLVSRTIDAILELSKNRLAVRKRTQRKNGLEYTERQLLLPRDVDVPGERTDTESSSEPTADRSSTSLVPGDT